MEPRKLMSRIRNPRYAPESLERKLSPSQFLGGLPTAADYFCPVAPTSSPEIPTAYPPLAPPPTALSMPVTDPTVISAVPAPITNPAMMFMHVSQPYTYSFTCGLTEPPPPDGDGNPPGGNP